MLTFQDYLQIGETEQAKIDFIKTVISQHKVSDVYRNALIAEDYYTNQNTTIKNYNKQLVTATGRLVHDEWSPNHKTTSGFFRRFVNQQNQYLLEV